MTAPDDPASIDWVRYELTNGGIATIALDDPGSRNALSTRW